MSSFLKRIGLFLSLLLVLVFGLIYFFIPDTFELRNSITINCNVAAADRTLIAKWKNIFHQYSSSAFDVDGYIYVIDKPVYNGLYLTIIRDSKIYSTVLSLLPLTSDSSMLLCNVTIKSSDNPFTKVIDYYKAKALQTSIANVLIQLQSFLSKTNNVYNFNISYTTLSDTILASIENVLNNYPSSEEIYSYVDTLREYVLANGATITNLPMLNIVKMNKQYTMMVGLPINREIAPNNRVKIKRLLQIKDKTLTTEVYGGLESIYEAHKQIAMYMQDHSLAAPVKSFDLLITNRINYKDTSKWVTRIYYPID